MTSDLIIESIIEAAVASMIPLFTGFFTIPLVMRMVGSKVSAKQSIAASFIFAFGRFVIYLITRLCFEGYVK